MERKVAIFSRPIFAALQGSYVISLVGTCWRAVCTDSSLNCTFNHKIRAVQLLEREPRKFRPGLALWLSPSFSCSQGADNCVCRDLIICTCKISVDWVLITATEQKKKKKRLQLLSQGRWDHCSLLSTFKCQPGLSNKAYPSHFEPTDKKARWDIKDVVTFGEYPTVTATIYRNKEAMCETIQRELLG